MKYISAFLSVVVISLCIASVNAQTYSDCSIYGTCQNLNSLQGLITQCYVNGGITNAPTTSLLIVPATINIFGSSTGLLGQPENWTNMTVNNVVYRIPLYR